MRRIPLCPNAATRGWYSGSIAAVRSTPTEFLVPISMACVAWIAALRRRGPAGRAGRAIGYRRAGSGGGGLMVPTAPEPRWGMFLFWPLASSGVAALMLTITNRDSGVRRARDRPAGGADVAHPDCLPHGSGACTVWDRTFQCSSVLLSGSRSWTSPLTNGTLQRIPQLLGNQFYFPQGNPYMWDGPLPSSPQLSRFLRLRREGDLGSGFRIDVPPGHRARVR